MIFFANDGGAASRQALTDGATLTADLTLPGMLHCALARATEPRAVLCALNLDEIKKLPGVLAALAAAPSLPTAVEYAGQIVAAVCAQTPAAAQRAAERVKASLEPQTPLLQAEAAFDESAPVARAGGNVVGRGVSERGDVEGSLARAHQVVMARFDLPAWSLAGLEPATFVAAPEGDGVRLWANRGQAFAVRETLASALGLAPARLRVLAMGQIPAGPVELEAARLVCQLALACGRPVKLVSPLADDVAAGCRLPGCVILGRAGVDAKGRLLALDLDVIVDGGANQNAPADLIALLGAHPYDLADWRFRVRQVFTNTPPALLAPAACAGAMTMAVEGLLGEAARQLGLDPLEARMQNAPADGVLRKCLVKAGSACKDLAAAGGPGRGVGLACFAWPAQTLAPTAEPCRVERLADGSVNLFAAAGRPAVLAQEAARALNVAPVDVRVVVGDTALCPQPPAGLMLGEAVMAQAVALACAAGDQRGAGATPAPCVGALAAAVEVDAETGQVRAAELRAVIGAGRPDAPSVMAMNQAGVGRALLAGLVWRAGRPVDAHAYRLPSSIDCPRQSVEWLAEADPSGEMGHGPALAVAPALAAAVAQACGAVCAGLPITPEGVLRALGRIR